MLPKKSWISYLTTRAEGDKQDWVIAKCYDLVTILRTSISINSKFSWRWIILVSPPTERLGVPLCCQNREWCAMQEVVTMGSMQSLGEFHG